jgi:hypothetical protein
MTSADLSSAARSRGRISIRRSAQRPATETATAASDALQDVLQRRALKRDGRSSQAEAGPSATEGSLSSVVAVFDDLRAQTGIPKQLVGVLAGAAVAAGLLLTLGPLVFQAGPPCPVHPVVGRIAIGKLVPSGAQVVFHPVGRQLPDQAVPRATVRDDGAFLLSTFGAEDGAPEGDYVVTIQWFRIGKDGAPGPNVLPVRYARPDSSPLKVAVGAGRNELPAFELAR